MSLSSAQTIILVTPVFFALIGVEAFVGWRRGRNTYRLPDAMNSIGLGMLSQLVGVLTGLVTLLAYTAIYEHVAPWHLSTSSPWVWIGALIAYDFLYYWLHRMGHEMAVLWAAHVVHHQSEEYNLTTALRQTGSGWLLGWIFYLPMAVVGVPPLVLVVVGLIDLLYQYWVHTQQIGRLGWFDRWFCSPSNHRVHHAVNEVYLDKNYGGILIIWDRLFGTFQDELDEEPCVYGTRDALLSWNPIRANWQVYSRLVAKTRRARGLDRLRVWFNAAHWQPASWGPLPEANYDPKAKRLYRPEITKAQLTSAIALFIAMLGATSALLWFSDQMSFWQNAAGLVAVTAGLSLVGWLCEPPEAKRVFLEQVTTR